MEQKKLKRKGRYGSPHRKKVVMEGRVNYVVFSGGTFASPQSKERGNDLGLIEKRKSGERHREGY